ncbi:hypothetical protein PHYC_01871 [Phycisphaerales bacterium]|nr:hypothetical protein PHYC_01871 [Phycisphaerales bacterium]
MNRRSAAIVILVGSGCFGAVAVATAQQSGQPIPRDRTRADTAPATFVSGSKLDGMSVKGPDGKKSGTVSDLVIDRGTGTVRYVVIDTGIASKSVAAPYDGLSWGLTDKETHINLTKDQLKTYPEFSAKRWNATPDDSTSDGENSLMERMRREYRQETSDPFAENLREAPAEDISGTIERVGREDTWSSDEQIVLTIRTGDGSRRVAVGPSWYVMSQDRVPVRGENITIHAFQVPERSHVTHVASSANINGKDIQFRNPDRHALWIERTGGNATRYQPGQQYLLLSNLDGKNVQCVGQACGDVHDVIVERGSGKVVLLVIDPDQNFLGIADTKRLIPFPVLSFSTKNEVGLDATKQMVLGSTSPPDDYALLTKEAVDNIYQTFDVDRPRYSTTKAGAPRPEEPPRKAPPK